MKCCALLVIFAALLFTDEAGAQAYPTRPVRIIVSNATGSSPEIVARILASKLTAQMGQQFVVDTRPGASGIIGVELVKTAAPDGYTMLVGSTTVFASLPALKANLPYDIERDFVPLTRLASVANVMVVQASLGVTDVAGFIKDAQANPGKLNCGHSGNGTPAHLAEALFNHMAKVDIQLVPYKGVAQALSDLIAGHVQCQLRSPEVSELLSKQGATVQPESPAAFAQYIREERNRIAALAKSAGIRID